MAELLAGQTAAFKSLKVGDLIIGLVTEKTSRTIYIDIGGKTEGMIGDREMKLSRDYIKSLSVGDQVKVVVTQAESDTGHPLLSLRRAAQDTLWTDFEVKLTTGEIITVRGREINKGGLVVDACGLQGFIPSSQFGAKIGQKLEGLIGQNLEVKTIEVDRDKNRLIFSEREVSEAGLLKAQAEALSKIQAGDQFAGKVTGVMPFGLFVKIDPPAGPSVEGLVHISEISWEKVDNPSLFFQPGNQVKVKVLAVDHHAGKLNLSIKQLLPDPWEGIETKYPVEAKKTGEVVRLAPFGAFVVFEPGIEGLVHISKLPAEKTLAVGDQINCYIESIDVPHRRMSLGLVVTEKPVGYK
jgi:4-hydroxy-3-methylbut-2-enyl diphosphate reductase